MTKPLRPDQQVVAAQAADPQGAAQSNPSAPKVAGLSEPTALEAAPAVAVSGLQVSYGGHTAIHDVTFEVAPGSMTAIIGPNGAGKSTLLKALLHLLPRDSGDVQILGEDARSVRSRVAYVPQRGDVDWTFPITVADTALLGTYPRLGVLRRPRRADRERALSALDKVGLTDIAARQIGQLSGGQQQRVFLARALAQEAEVILLDEPFVGVDATSEALILEILHGLRKAGTTIVVVHHDLTTAPDYFTHALLLNRTRVAYGPTDTTLTPELLATTYLPPAA